MGSWKTVKYVAKNSTWSLLWKVTSWYIKKPKRSLHYDSAFETNGQLLIHQRIHTQEKPFKCNFCERVYRQSCHLKEHQMSHSGERSYRCPECESCKTLQKLKITGNAILMRDQIPVQIAKNGSGLETALKSTTK